MAESQILKEVTEEIHQPKINKEVVNLLDLGVLGLSYAIFKVSHYDRVLVPEAEQGLL